MFKNINCEQLQMIDGLKGFLILALTKYFLLIDISMSCLPFSMTIQIIVVLFSIMTLYDMS